MTEQARSQNLDRGTQLPGGEQRGLTPDEMKQIDALLGLTGPTLISPATSAPEPAGGKARLLRTVIVAIMLVAIVAFAVYLFR